MERREKIKSVKVALAFLQVEYVQNARETMEERKRGRE